MLIRKCKRCKRDIIFPVTDDEIMGIAKEGSATIFLHCPECNCRCEFLLATKEHFSYNRYSRPQIKGG